MTNKPEENTDLNVSESDIFKDTQEIGKKCRWQHIEENDYQTTCNNLFTFLDGTPKEKGFEFCPYCGKRLTSFY